MNALFGCGKRGVVFGCEAVRMCGCMLYDGRSGGRGDWLYPVMYASGRQVLAAEGAYEMLLYNRKSAFGCHLNEVTVLTG